MKYIPLILLLIFIASCAGNIQTPDGTRLAYTLYEVNTTAPTVILIHMLDESRQDWNAFATQLQTAGHSTISFDLRGHGRSTGNWSAFTPDEWQRMINDVRYVKQRLRQNGDTNSLTVIGAGLGASVALNYAAQDGDVKRLVLLSPGHDYRGIIVDDPTESINIPVLAVTSFDDFRSTDNTWDLNNISEHVQTINYTQAGSGTEMFATTTLEQDIISWIQQHI